VHAIRNANPQGEGRHPESAADRIGSDRYRRRRWLAACAFLVVLAVIAISIWLSRRTRVSLPRGVPLSEYKQARAEFQSAYRRKADEIDTFSWLAERYVKDHELEKAAACFERIPTSHPLWGRSARHQQGNVMLLLDRAAEAERQFREFIDRERRDPRSSPAQLVDAIERLRFVLEVQLRFEERRTLIGPMVRAGKGDVFDVIYYCFPSLLRWNGPEAAARLERFWRADPRNLKLRIALGRYRTGQGRLDEAADILSECRREAPKDPAAVAAELALFRERGAWDRIIEEIDTLPPPSASDPWLLLLIRGQAYNRGKDYRRAIRCFQLVFQTDPANSECCLGLAAAYAGLHQPVDQKRMLAKANVLARIQNRLGWGQSSPKDVQPFIEIAELCEQIELYEEGLLIARLAARTAPKNAVLQKVIPRLESEWRNPK
jgi:tetratricopeptide (TPR) repeat protein